MISHKPFFNLLFALIAISFFSQSCSTKSAEDHTIKIAQWRGDNRDGIYHETDLLDKWPESGPELLWAYEGIGKGYAAPSVLNDRIFVNGEQDSSSFLFAFDLNGKLLWKQANGEEFMGEGFSATYPGSRSTPTVASNLVYTTSGKGRIACYDVETGTEKWAKSIVDDYSADLPYFGYSESLIVDGNKLYCFPAGPQHNTLALNRFTGEIIWSNKAMQDTFSYCSPLLVELPERKVIITHSRHHLYALDTENGNALGSYFIGHYEYDGEHCNSPLYDNGSIYFIGNEKEDGAIKLNISNNGEDFTRVWQNSKIKNNFNGYIKIGNTLFTTVKGNWLKAINTENGMVTDSIKAATGSLIYADNKLICYGMNGTTNLLTFNNNKLEVKSTFKVKNGSGQHFSHPVIAEGVMYIRHGDALLAYKIK